jgi:hypothetical protein
MPDYRRQTACWPGGEARCRRCCANTRACAARSQVALREKVHGIWQATTWAQYHEHRAATWRWPAVAGARAGRPHRHRLEDVPAWFFADLGAQMIGVQCGGHLPDQPLAGTAVHRAPLPGQGGGHRRPGADRQGAGRDGQGERPAAPAAGVLRRHEGPAPLRSPGLALQLRRAGGRLVPATRRTTRTPRPGSTRRSTRSSPTT